MRQGGERLDGEGGRVAVAGLEQTSRARLRKWGSASHSPKSVKETLAETVPEYEVNRHKYNFVPTLH